MQKKNEPRNCENCKYFPDQPKKYIYGYCPKVEEYVHKYEWCAMGKLSTKDRLPFDDCAFSGCDGYAEKGEKYCAECLKVVRCPE